MDKNELLNLDRKARRICDAEPCLAYRGPFQYQVTVRRKGYPTATKTFDDIEAARDYRDRTRSEMKRGTFIDTSLLTKNTLADLLDRYSREVTPGKKGQRQELSRLRVIGKHPVAGEVVGCISGTHIAAYRDARLKEVGPKTVREEINTLRHVFKIAMQEWGLPLQANPADHVRKPSPARPRDRRLQGEEEQRLLTTAGEYGGVLQDVITLALETGMRRGEIAGLRWGDIKGTVAHLEDTKNGERRDVPLSSTARAVVNRQVRKLHDQRVFGIQSDGIGRAFRRTTERAGITGLTFHDLRHEATSRLFEKGLNPMQVASITGHKTLQMLKRYTHLKAEDLAKMLG